MGIEHEFTEEELTALAGNGVVYEPAPAPAAEEEPAPVAEEEPAPVAEQGAEGPARDPVTGQFMAKEEPASAEEQPAPAEEQPAAPPQGFVPHAALHQARMQAQQAQQQLLALQARTNAILAAQQPQAAELPDLDEDPVGYVRGLEARLRQFEDERNENVFNSRIDNAMMQDEASFRAYTPDYDAASEHYVQSRAQELLALYTPQQAQSIMMQEARQMAQEAWQRGIPAAQMVYQLAHARGYQPGAAPQTPPTAFAPPAAPQQPQPAAIAPQPSPAPVNAPVLTPAAVVAAAQAGQAATRTLSTGAGAPATAQLNAEALLNMSDEEFENYLRLGTKGANARFAAIG